MCGVLAAIGNNSVVSLLLQGLEHLEYRGYDSAGLATIDGQGDLLCFRSINRVQHLMHQARDMQSNIGLAHTRWATHGQPSLLNTHPLVSDSIAIAHNGIIDNDPVLKERLRQNHQIVFSSETDSESIAHLIKIYRQMGLSFRDAVQKTITQLEGYYSFVAMDARNPDTLIGYCAGPALVVGLATGLQQLSSDVCALWSGIQETIFLEEGCLVVLQQGRPYDISTRRETKPQVQPFSFQHHHVSPAPYKHYMYKEIREQPTAITNTLSPLLTNRKIDLDDFTAYIRSSHFFDGIERVLIIGCGTSYHAALCGRYWIEQLSHLPTAVEIASEFLYRDAVVEKNTLVIAISQSGETFDTLSAMRQLRNTPACKTLAICNVATSALARHCQSLFLTVAGPEVGVASTKAFTTQLAALHWLALCFAKFRQYLSLQEEEQAIAAWQNVPSLINTMWSHEKKIKRWATYLTAHQHALLLGRGIHYPIVLEGALKLKETSYSYAEGFTAGELKHGPLALVEQGTPVIVLLPQNALFHKTRNNIQEVRARGAQLFVIDEASTHPQDLGPFGSVLTLPAVHEAISPILHVVVLQLLAYHTALQKGSDVDKPRNLAKSVTVE